MLCPPTLFHPGSSRLRQGFMSILAGVLLLSGCAPAASSPTSAPAKAAATSAPASPGAPAASPGVAKPAASPAASPAAQASAPPGLGPAPKPVAKLADFPTKPLEIIVPFGPGGGFDTVARQLAIPMQKLLGQPVVVKNVPGGGQRLAARQFQSLPPDGYTLGYFSEPPLYVSTFVESAEGFDLRSWTSVAGVRKSPFALLTRKDSPFNTVDEIIAADTAGQRLRFGNEGIGGHLLQHVVLVEALGLKNAVHVGGFQGSADIAPSVIRGDTDLVFASPITSWLRFIESGDLRPIFVLEAQRNPLIPNTPTAREMNVPNAAQMESALATFVYGITTMPNTPADRQAVLESAVLNAIHDPEFLAWAKGAGVEADLLPLPGKEFQELKFKSYDAMRTYEEALKKAVG
jgi:tripartite-type tricarboxylate transporter receptor subunit TctC